MFCTFKEFPFTLFPGFMAKEQNNLAGNFQPRIIIPVIFLGGYPVPRKNNVSGDLFKTGKPAARQGIMIGVKENINTAFIPYNSSQSKIQTVFKARHKRIIDRKFLNLDAPSSGNRLHLRYNIFLCQPDSTAAGHSPACSV